MIERIGIDFGNVIIDHVGFGTTTDYVCSGNYNLIPPVSGAFEALKIFNSTRFKENVYIVYNASNVAEEKIYSWLFANNFFFRTGILPKNIRRTKGSRDKSGFCKELKLTHFIDDRLEALSYLIGTVEHLYLFKGQSEEIEQYKYSLKDVKILLNWDLTIKLLIYQNI